VRILLFGKIGQLGWELQRALAPLGDVTAPSQEEVDLEDLSLVRSVVRDTKPDVVVNAAAYTAVDKAETDVRRAERLNAEAVDVMAEESARCGAWLVHYSTDYVFDGTQTRPYREDDAANPLSVYGRTKLAGEEAIRARNPRHLIFRTSWLFATCGGNFAKTILHLARERDEIRIVADQHGAPTSAELVADVTALVLHRICNGGGNAFAGTYHVAARGETTWYDYARYVLEEARKHGFELKAGADRVRAIATEDYPIPAARPRSSRLDTEKLETTFKLSLPDWHTHVARVVAELAALRQA
jgi:dTDP-4-dehydrorhamnose reductase